jgi:protein-tyrosine phosphatase
MEYFTSTFKVAYDKISNLLMPTTISNISMLPVTKETFNTSIINTQPQLESPICDINTIDTIDINNTDINNTDTNNEIDEHIDLSNSRVRIFQTMPYVEQLLWFYGEPTYIKNNIYLGSSFNAANKSMLDKHNIKYIINITAEINNYYPNDITYVNYKMYDNNKESILHFLEDSYKKIKQFQQNNDGNILIHCFMGASRSATLVAYYLMREFNIEPYYAYRLLKKRRKLVNPTKLLYNDLKRIKKCIKQN